MSAQPEALRLADALDAVPETGADPDLIQESADELRGLYAENAFLAALAQQAEPCPTQRKPVVSVDELANHIRVVDGNHSLGAGALAEKIVEFLIERGISKESCDAGPRAALAQQEPAQPAAESTYHPCTFILIEGLKKLKAWDVLSEWDKARDIVDKRFRAALAQQDEPVQELVAKVELMTTGGNAGLATRIVEIDDHLRERLRPGQLLYTAPLQRKPLTKEEVERCFRDAGITIKGHRWTTAVRNVERAHGIGEQP